MENGKERELSDDVLSYDNGHDTEDSPFYKVLKDPSLSLSHAAEYLAMCYAAACALERVAPHVKHKRQADFEIRLICEDYILVPLSFRCKNLMRSHGTVITHVMADIFSAFQSFLSPPSFFSRTQK